VCPNDFSGSSFQKNVDTSRMRIKLFTKAVLFYVGFAMFGNSCRAYVSRAKESNEQQKSTHKPSISLDMAASIPNIFAAEAWNRTLLDRPALEKIEPLSDLGRDYLSVSTGFTFGNEELTSLHLSHEERNKIVDVIRTLPPAVQKLVDTKLISLSFVKGLARSGLNGFTGTMYKGSVGEFGFIVIDADVLSQKANDRLAARERQYFVPSFGYMLKAGTETPMENTPLSAFRFLLLHELGHLLHETAVDFPVVSSAKDAAKRTGFSGPFGSIVRERMSLVLRNFADGKFNLEKPFPKITNAGKVFYALDQSGLPSIYAAVNPYEDFAESFAMWVHCDLMFKSHHVTVLRDSRPVWRFSGCDSLEQVPVKTQLFERILQPGAPPFRSVGFSVMRAL
jgi:hypothetical protein